MFRGVPGKQSQSSRRGPRPLNTRGGDVEVRRIGKKSPCNRTISQGGGEKGGTNALEENRFKRGVEEF